MNILGVIPARGGSKGVARKNIRPLNGKPLIAYTVEESCKSKYLTRVIVSTDDLDISDVARKCGADVPFIRPAELATDSAPAIDVVIHALLEVEKLNKQVKYEIIVLLQPTAPFRKAEDIDGAIDLLVNNKADSVISVVSVGGHHPARMKYLERNRLIDPPFCEAYENQPRQELKPMVIRNGAIYATKRETLLRRSFKGKVSMAWIMPPERSINIDSEYDFHLAEWLGSK